MAQINTVLGPIDASELGFTLSHEHVAMQPPSSPSTTRGWSTAKRSAAARSRS